LRAPFVVRPFPRPPKSRASASLPHAGPLAKYQTLNTKPCTQTASLLPAGALVDN
jgi:hypothetical protein